ncbi:MAG: hypothetical protein OHK0038_19050 [Flammeovirgaceae bacterium]
MRFVTHNLIFSFALFLVLLLGCQKEKEQIAHQSTLDSAKKVNNTPFLAQDWVQKINLQKSYLLQRLPTLIVQESPYYNIGDVSFQVNVYKENGQIVMVQELNDMSEGGESLKRFFIDNNEIQLIEFIEKNYDTKKQKYVWKKYVHYFRDKSLVKSFSVEGNDDSDLVQNRWQEFTFEYEEQGTPYEIEQKEVIDLIDASDCKGEYVLLFRDIEDYGTGELFLRMSTKNEHDVLFLIPEIDETIAMIQKNKTSFEGRYVKVIYTLETKGERGYAIYHKLTFLN